MIDRHNNNQLNLIFIDASNIGSGGGINHLKEVLTNLPTQTNDKRNICTIWCSNELKDKLPKLGPIIYKNSFLFLLPYPLKFIWSIFFFRIICFLKKPDFLYFPGGLQFFRYKNSTILFQNVLPFIDEEIYRYPAKIRIKWQLLRMLQRYSSAKANKQVFLSHNSYDVIKPFIHESEEVSIINHGINPSFIIKEDLKLKRALNLKDKITNNKPLDFVYVASAEKYKNHLELLKSFEYIHEKNIPFKLQLILSDGSFTNEIIKLIEESSIFKYIDLSLNLDLKDVIYNLHNKANIFIFASSCESFGQILVEGMAAGLPIYSLNKSCIPEILEDSGFYFDIKKPASLYNALESSFKDLDNVDKISTSAWNNSKNYSWKKCSKETWEVVLKNE